MIDVLFTQRILMVSGFDPKGLDGRWGTNTQKAQDAFDKQFAETAKDLGTFDPRTEGNIHTLIPVAQIAARKFLNAVPKSKFVVKILSGTRTYAEQHALFNQHPVVTHADAGQSNHNWGIAWDCGIFVAGEYYDGSDRDPARARAEEQAYIDLRAATKASVPNIRWGGDWSTIVDRPHYEVYTGKKISEVRALFEAGKAYV